MSLDIMILPLRSWAKAVPLARASYCGRGLRHCPLHCTQNISTLRFCNQVSSMTDPMENPYRSCRLTRVRPAATRSSSRSGTARYHPGLKLNMPP